MTVAAPMDPVRRSGAIGSKRRPRIALVCLSVLVCSAFGGALFGIPPCPPGSGEDAAGNCLTCPEGTFGDGFTCELCPPGFAQGLTGQPDCDQCPAGRFAAGLRNTTCTPCPAGFFSAGGADTCSPCAPGTASSVTETAGQCPDCPAGRFAPGLANLTCDLCGAGSYSAPGAAECTACAPGSAQDLTGQPSCTQCAAGTFASGSGNTSCAVCAHGERSADGASQCEGCGPGSYAPGPGQSCEVCAIGTFSTGCANSTCTPCPAGMTTEGVGALFCVPESEAR